MTHAHHAPAAGPALHGAGGHGAAGFDPIILLYLLVAAGVLAYAGLLWRQRALGRGWPLHRSLLFALGIALVAYGLSPALMAAGHAGLRVHMTQHMLLGMFAPLALVLGLGFLLLTVTFVATTADSMSYAVAEACTLHDDPPAWLRGLWTLIMGTAAAALISIGDGGISALQSFIVVTAVPVGFVVLPSVFAAPIYMRRLAIEQGAVHDKSSETTRTAPKEGSV